MLARAGEPMAFEAGGQESRAVRAMGRGTRCARTGQSRRWQPGSRGDGFSGKALERDDSAVTQSVSKSEIQSGALPPARVRGGGVQGRGSRWASGNRKPGARRPVQEPLHDRSQPPGAQVKPANFGAPEVRLSRPRETVPSWLPPEQGTPMRGVQPVLGVVDIAVAIAVGRRAVVRDGELDHDGRAPRPRKPCRRLPVDLAYRLAGTR